MTTLTNLFAGRHELTHWTENEIRDFLAGNLDLIEEGLELVGTEHYLPAGTTTKCFLDIFARDALGRLVVIEIKRADATAREAIHELHKYFRSLLSNYALKRGEIRLILASTAWRELIGPFSEFAATSPLPVEAVRLVTSDTGVPYSTETVALTPPAMGRTFSRRHMVWFYADPEDRASDLQRLDRFFADREVGSYIWILTSLAEKSHPARHVLYMAPLRQSVDDYKLLIPSLLPLPEVQEWQEVVADLDEVDDILDVSSEYLCFSGWPHDEMRHLDAEIGYPEKLSQLMKISEMTSLHLERRGALSGAFQAEKNLLRDLTQDANYTLIDREYSIGHKGDLSDFLRDIEDVLYTCPDWRSQVADIAKLMSQRAPSSRLQAYAYYPGDILEALSTFTLDLPPAMLPLIRLTFSTEGGEAATFAGGIEWNGRAPNLDEIRAMCRNAMHYELLKAAGDIQALDRALCRTLGLSFHLFTLDDEGALCEARALGSTLSLVRAATPPAGLFELHAAHSESLDELIQELLEMRLNLIEETVKTSWK